jgi:hypothetical protein
MPALLVASFKVAFDRRESDLGSGDWRGVVVVAGPRCRAVKSSSLVLDLVNECLDDLFRGRELAPSID